MNEEKMNDPNETAAIKEIPYGIADYERIRRENYYYVDKTPYLQTLKKAGRYLFFIRPRRFGKSLFLSLMEAYYDVYYKDRFEEFFKGTWIYDHLEKLTDAENFTSLLFYLGLLAIRGPEKDKLRLRIPNETVKSLYYRYIEEAYRETGIFDLDLDKYANLMTDMAYDGKWKPLLGLITGRMKQSMSLRDLITGEKSIQAFLNVYLGLSDLFIIHTEREMNKGYCDMVMEPFLARYEGIKYAYILEIKYITAGEGKKIDNGKIRQLRSAAQEQLENYSIDEKFKKTIEKTHLIKIHLIFSGHELIDMAEMI